MAFEQYHEPASELSQEVRTFARMMVSLIEEAQAIDWYEQRISLEKDKQARAIMENAQKEEFKHFGMDLEFLLRKKPKWRATLKEFYSATEISSSTGRKPKRIPSDDAPGFPGLRLILFSPIRKLQLLSALLRTVAPKIGSESLPHNYRHLRTASFGCGSASRCNLRILLSRARSGLHLRKASRVMQRRLRVALAYKNFAVNRVASHFGLGITAINNSKLLRENGIRSEVWPVSNANELRARLEEAKREGDPVTHAIMSAPWITSPIGNR